MDDGVVSDKRYRPWYVRLVPGLVLKLLYTSSPPSPSPSHPPSLSPLTPCHSSSSLFRPNSIRISNHPKRPQLRRADPPAWRRICHDAGRRGRGSLLQAISIWTASGLVDRVSGEYIKMKRGHLEDRRESGSKGCRGGRYVPYQYR